MNVEGYQENNFLIKFGHFDIYFLMGGFSVLIDCKQGLCEFKVK